MTFHNPNQGPGPGSHPDLKIYNNEDFVEQVKAQCGWDLKVASEQRIATPPSQETLALLRNKLDPDRLFLG